MTVKHTDSGQLDPRANASSTLYTLGDLGQLVLGSTFPFWKMRIIVSIPGAVGDFK